MAGLALVLGRSESATNAGSGPGRGHSADRLAGRTRAGPLPGEGAAPDRGGALRGTSRLRVRVGPADPGRVRRADSGRADRARDAADRARDGGRTRPVPAPGRHGAAGTVEPGRVRGP